ncbi:MAG TPA: DUF6503 family protein [Cyclobacteriaceae bacterium]|nr:DUF6503 family protein [Cyclobacteriaceae bacterium]
MKIVALFLVAALLLGSCGKKSESGVGHVVPKFNAAESDPAALELADSVMLLAGGDAWSQMKYISWSAPERKLVWDTQRGKLRMENQKENAIYLVDLNSGQGRVQQNGNEITDPTELKNMLAKAKFIWMNDIYALAMPFRLKDAGATLKYMGEDSLKGNIYNVLQLTLANDGTSQDKYKVYVDIKAKVIKYWSYFADANQDTASFTRAWSSDKYGNVMLSAGSGGVKLDDKLPETTFTEF